MQRKLLSSDVIIGNFIIEASIRCQEKISIDSLSSFDTIISKSIYKIGYVTDFSIERVIEFKENYPFFMSQTNEIYISKVDKLIKYFRIGLSNKLIHEFELAADTILGEYKI